MGNVIASAIVYGLLALFCLYVVRSWRHWYRSKSGFPKTSWRTCIAFLGFVSASVSLFTIIALAVHALLTGGFPYYSPPLIFAFRLGFLTALCGVLAALIGTGPLEIPTIVSSLMCLVIWLAEAAAQ